MNPANHAATSIATVSSPTPPYAQIAVSLRRIFLAGSSKIGVDSLHHAVLAHALLKDLGFDAEVKIGYAAWRVGPGDGDVIVHAPNVGQPKQANNAHPFHAWVECSGVVFDATSYQFAVKATALDLIDGRTTDLQWEPLFLAIKCDELQPLNTVLQADVGMCYYEHVPALQAVVMSGVPPVDEDELEIVNVVFNHPSARTLCPDSVHAALVAA